MVYFLIANRKEGCTGKALDWSSHGGHDKINHSLSESARLRVSGQVVAWLLFPIVVVTVVLLCSVGVDAVGLGDVWVPPLVLVLVLPFPLSLAALPLRSA